MKLEDFNITDNGDGTFTLTPKDGIISGEELVREYRQLKRRADYLLNQRSQINTELLALATRRDELRALATGAGLDPDAVPTP